MKRCTKYFALITALLMGTSWGTLHAQSLPERRQRAVLGRSFYVFPSRYDYQSLTDSITQGATTDYERGRRIYDWLVGHIRYDDSGLVRTADEAWLQRKAVCQGYCELFYRMASTQDMDVDIIYGRGRSPRGLMEREHCWLGLQTERGYILLDPTWEASMPTHDDCLWYDVSPSWFVFTHMPHKKRHQHLIQPITHHEFLRLPFATQRMQQIGWGGDEALRYALTDTIIFPRLRPTEAVQYVEVPRYGLLQVGRTYTFSIRKATPCRIYLQQGALIVSERKWQVSPDGLQLSFAPTAPGPLHLVVEQGGISRVVVEWTVTR